MKKQAFTAPQFSSEYSYDEQAFYFRFYLIVSFLLFVTSICGACFATYQYGNSFSSIPLMINMITLWIVAVLSLLVIFSAFQSYKKAKQETNTQSLHSKLIFFMSIMLIIALVVCTYYLFYWKHQIESDYLINSFDKNHRSLTGDYLINSIVLTIFNVITLLLLGFTTFAANNINPDRENIRFCIYILSAILALAVLAQLHLSRKVINLQGVEALRKTVDFTSIKLIDLSAFVFLILIIFICLFNYQRWKGLYLISGGTLLVMAVLTAGCLGRTYKNLNDINDHFSNGLACRSYLSNIHARDVENYGCKQKYLDDCVNNTKDAKKCGKGTFWSLRWELDLFRTNEKKFNQISPLNMNCCPVLSRFYSGWMLTLSAVCFLVLGLAFALGSLSLYLASKYHAPEGDQSRVLDYIFIGIVTLLSIVFLILIFTATEEYKPISPKPYIVDFADLRQKEVVVIEKSQNVSNYPASAVNRAKVSSSLRPHVAVAIDKNQCITAKCEFDALRVALLVKNGFFLRTLTFSSPNIRIYDNRAKKHFFPEAPAFADFIAFEGYKSDIEKYLEEGLRFSSANPLFVDQPSLEQKLEQIDFRKNVLGAVNPFTTSPRLLTPLEELRVHLGLERDPRLLQAAEPPASNQFSEKEIIIKGHKEITGYIRLDSEHRQFISGNVYTQSFTNREKFIGVPDAEVCLSNDAVVCTSYSVRSDTSGLFNLSFPLLKGNFAYTVWLLVNKRNYVPSAMQVTVGGEGGSALPSSSLHKEIGYVNIITPDGIPREADEKIFSIMTKRILESRPMKGHKFDDDRFKSYQSNFDISTQLQISSTIFFGNLRLKIYDLDDLQYLSDVNLKVYNGDNYCQKREDELPLREGTLRNSTGGFTFYNLPHNVYTIYASKPGYHVNCFRVTITQQTNKDRENDYEGFLLKRLKKNQVKSIVEWKNETSQLYLYSAFNIDDQNVCRVSHFQENCGGVSYRSIENKSIDVITIETLGPYNYLFSVKPVNNNDELFEGKPQFKMYVGELAYPAVEYLALPSETLNPSERLSKEKDLSWLLHCIQGNSSTVARKFSSFNGQLWSKEMKVLTPGGKEETIPKLKGQQHPNPNLCNFIPEA